MVLVCRGMRAANAAETAAMRGEVDPTRYASELNAHYARIGQFRYAFCDDRRALIALLAVYFERHCAVQLIATEAWPQIAHAAYRYLRKVVVGKAFALYGVETATTDVLDRGSADRKWLRALGFADDGPPRPLGRKGELFQRVVWRAIDARPPNLVSAASSLGRAGWPAHGPVSDRTVSAGAAKGSA